jgi:plastocyanin
MPRTATLVPAVLVALTLTLTLAMGAFAVSGAGASTPRAKSASVKIKNFAFSPKTLTVKAGTKIKVQNSDGTTHTFTADQGAFDTGEIGGGKSATVTVKAPGTYQYHCKIHSSMHGTIKAT